MMELRKKFCAGALAGYAFLCGSVNAADSNGPPKWGVYEQPLANLTLEERAMFEEASSIFRREWLPETSPRTARFASLGPYFNRSSCTACHVGNGRGEALVRISVPGASHTGGPRHHEVYGDQVQTDAIASYEREANVFVRWIEMPTILADGTVVSLRRAEIELRDLNYGPLPSDLQISARTSPPIFGLGLLEAVSQTDIEELAARTNSDGVKGRVNMVWDLAHKKVVPGRFGLKANQPNLTQQIAAALASDMGITSSIFPDPDCPGTATACAATGPLPEISEGEFTELWRYIELLAPPSRRPMTALAARGETIFRDIGCALCHRESLNAGRHEIHPYTDLLLHDMGDGLADGRPEFLASGRDWRTAPLWGIGSASAVNSAAAFLHDGRARTLTEAILWHGGEAQISRDRFAMLSWEGRDAILAFLETL
jgi:CxxC motif-containing protein (DUF1111 family)